MCDKDPRDFTDDEIRVILKFQKEKVLRMLEEDKDTVEQRFREGKEKVEDTTEKIFKAVTDPEVQKHFVRAGLEFLSGIDSMLRAAPFSEKTKSRMERAEKYKDEVVNDVFCEMNPNCKAKERSHGPEKIELE